MARTAARRSASAAAAGLLLFGLRRSAPPPASTVAAGRHCRGPSAGLRPRPWRAGACGAASMPRAAMEGEGAAEVEEEEPEDSERIVDADLAELSPEEFLELMEASGAFEGQEEALEKLRAMAAKGVHPAQALGVWRRMPEEEPRERVLGSFDVEGIGRHVREQGCKKVVVLCGAGISTSAGIPDFRTPGTGLYDNLQRYNLSRPELIFDLDFFREKPGAFYHLCKELWPGRYAPTPAHYFIRLLHEKGVLSRCYTQNIDSLECLAGLPKDKLVAAHGNFDGAHVIDTDPEQEVDISELKAAVDGGEDGWQALRARRGNLVKPKIVFFGEQLPDRFYSLYPADLRGCNLLIVLGTSLVIQPFAGLVSAASAGAPRLLVNREAVGTCDRLEFGFRFNLAEEGANWRDVWYEGDCDAGCRELAAALGWEEDLDALIRSQGSAAIQPAPWAT